MKKDNSLLCDEKRKLRIACKQIQSDMGSFEWTDLGAKMSSILLQSEIWKNAESIFCFVSMQKEPDTSVIISEALRQGKILCVPRIVSKGIMQSIVIDSIDELAPAVMGIKEPVEANSTIVLPDKVSLAIVPCLAGAYDGSRLGKGGGYYDRFLAVFKGTSVLMCPETFILEMIPTEKHDCKADYVLTEKQLKKVR